MRMWIAVVIMAVVAAQGGQLAVSPAQVDFGKAVVRGTARRDVTVSSAVGDTLSLSISGPNASEFQLDVSSVLCNRNGNPIASCPAGVFFSPASLGRRTATLLVTNPRGQRFTVALVGEGVQEAMCTATIVFCNYAHLYTGTFTWQISLQAPSSSDVTNVQMNVIDGKASCTGSTVSTSQGADTIRQAILGSGLFAVEFVQDPLYPVAYKISAACPTPVGGGRSQPASLGNGISMESPVEPAKVIGENLNGTVAYPAPETDPVNSVTGTVQIAWNLKR